MTKLEQDVSDALLGANIPIQREVQFGSFSVDFVAPSLMLAIEVDGEYWHDLMEEKQPLTESW
jgi:very-short-patch-repair endonuclease